MIKLVYQNKTVLARNFLLPVEILFGMDTSLTFLFFERYYSLSQVKIALHFIYLLELTFEMLEIKKRITLNISTPTVQADYTPMMRDDSLLPRQLLWLIQYS